VEGGVIGVRKGVQVSLGGAQAAVTQPLFDDLKIGATASSQDACACRRSRKRTLKSRSAAASAGSHTFVRNQTLVRLMPAAGTCIGGYCAACSEPAASPASTATRIKSSSLVTTGDGVSWKRTLMALNTGSNGTWTC
jgi:hypothetical protein